MGLPTTTLGGGGGGGSGAWYHTHKAFLFCNYILLGAASSCIFLTISLRLIPSLTGFALILLHILTIAGAVSGCAAASSASGASSKWYGVHMVGTVLTAIFQGSVAVLIFSRTGEFLGSLKSYVREDDGAVILKLGGGLCAAIFCLEWVVLALAFMLRYYAYLGRDCEGKGSSKVQHYQEDVPRDWPWPFQV